MFTGLIESVGNVLEVKPAAGGARVRIGTRLASDLSPGESLALNGVCLTVIVAGDGQVQADVGPETLRLTAIGGLAPGALVNLERPLRADGRFGGHLVQGHVDATGYIEDLRQDAEFHWLTVSFPSRLRPYIIPKGSIAIDGISLTVAGLGQDRLDIMVIPHTMASTNLKHAQIRDRVNIECDMVGKYVVRAAELAGLSLTPVRAGERKH
ncbi:MAG: riboflavin synthase [Acidimicrobiia bacterium]|nr:riboflavin synthase [Acidimicrobiia bacterium]